MAVISGTEFSDNLEGTLDADTMAGLGGDDLLYGDSGADMLDGGEGNDRLEGGVGPDSMLGGAGDDQLTDASYGDLLKDTLIDGGSGTDTAFLTIEASAAGVTFSIADPSVAQRFNGTTLVNVERLIFAGGDGSNNVTGGSLDDILLGIGGSDTLHGGAGNDHIDGGGGLDALFGGAGEDFFNVSYGQEGTLVDGGAGTDRVFTGRLGTAVGVTFSIEQPNAAQTFDGTTLVNVEQLFFSGGSGDDNVTGGSRGDQLQGSEGADTLNGGAGNDLLQGGPGGDTIIGGRGRDLLYADPDRREQEFQNIFVFRDLDSRTGGGARDVIDDFERGFDRIDVSALGITDVSQLTLKQVGSGLIVYGDLDGDGLDSRDFGLHLIGLEALSSHDFIFA